MKLLMLSLLLLLPSTVYSQTNQCSGTAPGNITNPKEIVLEVAEFNAVDPNMVSVISNFTIEIRQGTTVIQTFVLPKTSFTLQPGTPANCYKFALPILTAGQANTLYQVAVRSNGATLNSTFGVSSNSFFLQGAPTAPSNIRLVLLDMLSKMQRILLSIKSIRN